jgi:hypothetical protein
MNGTNRATSCPFFGDYYAMIRIVLVCLDERDTWLHMAAFQIVFNWRRNPPALSGFVFPVYIHKNGCYARKDNQISSIHTHLTQLI